MPDRGLVLGGDAVRMRTVRLGSPLKRPVWRNAADAGGSHVSGFFCCTPA